VNRTRNTLKIFGTKDIHTWKIANNTESTAGWNLIPQRWGSSMVQEKTYEEEKACGSRNNNNNNNNNERGTIRNFFRLVTPVLCSTAIMLADTSLSRSCLPI
jgi:hypothetical protein